MTTELPKNVMLEATEPNSLSHHRSWFVVPTDDHTPLYSPDSSDQDASLKACETWLKNRGYRESGPMPPQCFEYSR